MNTHILQKCVEELKKQDFSKEYVLGMLETLVMLDDNKKPMFVTHANEVKVIQPVQPEEIKEMSDEEINLSKYEGRV